MSLLTERTCAYFRPFLPVGFSNMMLVLECSLGGKDPSLQAPGDPRASIIGKDLDNGLERTALSPRFNGMDADDRFRYASVYCRLFA